MYLITGLIFGNPIGYVLKFLLNIHRENLSLVIICETYYNCYISYFVRKNKGKYKFGLFYGKGSKKEKLHSIYLSFLSNNL